MVAGPEPLEVVPERAVAAQAQPARSVPGAARGPHALRARAVRGREEIVRRYDVQLACGPTQIGSSRHPCWVWCRTQPRVRCFWGQARRAPPM